LKKKRERRHGRRKAARAVQVVREYFSSAPHVESDAEPPDVLEGGLGVREPRRTLDPTLSGAVALEAPLADTRDTWAIGEDAGPSR